MLQRLLLSVFTLGLCFSAVAQEPPLEPPYTRSPKPSAPSKPLEKPISISEEGEYQYQEEDYKDAVEYEIDYLPKLTGAAYIRFGMIGPYEINGDSGKTYEQIYTDNSSFLAQFEYEWYLAQALGKWTVKVSTGLTMEEGTGSFASGSAAQAREKFLFIIFPNTVLLNYKLKFSDTQWVTPYFEGGPGYFSFIEQRTDGDRTAFGGAGVLAVGGGLMLSMNLIDKNAGALFYEDYGVSHLWFDLNIRRNTGLDKQKDFSSNVFSAGFGFGF